MKLSSSIITAALLSFASEASGAAFVGNDFGCVRTSSTQLRLTDWEDAEPSRRGPVDPSKSIQSYLPPPAPASARPNLDGTVLVSGFENQDGRPDQQIFDLLNGSGEDPSASFSFDKIVAFVNDVPKAKKSLVSRSARYSGLLNKLDFLESSPSSSLPTPEQLEGVRHWVARASGSDGLSLVAEIGKLIESTDVENISILLTDATDMDVYQSEDAIKKLSEGGGKTTFTVVAVGDVDQSSFEGMHPYAIEDFGTKGGKIPVGSTYSSAEATRLVAECLGLTCASNRALSFTQVMDVNATETKLVLGLREAGYGWDQELEHMLEGGVKKYDDACKDYDENHKVEGEGESWLQIAEDKLKKAMKEEEERQAAREAEWLREREVAMEAERIKMEEGMAEWA